MKECNCHRGPEVGKKIVGCPPKVININHPAEPVLFHRIDIPASMGDDVTYPPTNGLYKNILLVYEANNHTYLYNSDGIPTSLSLDVSELEKALATEVDDRKDADLVLQGNIDGVAQDLEDFKNSPDVVDIVATYADLEAYDTSDLGDQDVIRVLADETHDGESSYYRWDKTAETWTFIGATGPYYTKTEMDTIIESVYGKPKVLTANDYNWNSSTQSATEPYNCVAVWLLPAGIYHKIDSSVNARTTLATLLGTDEIVIVGKPNSNNNRPLLKMDATVYAGGTWSWATAMVVPESGNVAGMYYELKPPADNLTTTGMDIPLAAKQGKILNEKIDANLGKVRELTVDDYDWPESLPVCVAIWKLDPGIYYAQPNAISYKVSPNSSQDLSGGTFVVMHRGANGTNPGFATVFYADGTNWNLKSATTQLSNDVAYGPDAVIVRTSDIIDSLTNSSSTKPLSANQGKVLNEKITTGLGKAKTLSAADYNVNSADWSDTDPENFNAVALCRLDPGYYIVPSGVNGYVTSARATGTHKSYLVGVQGTYGVLVAEFEMLSFSGLGVEAGTFYNVVKSNGGSTLSYTLAAPVDSLTQISSTHPLSANQGAVLSSRIGNLSELSTFTQASLVAAINEVNRENNYNSTEKNTEHTWVDAKEIYKKTITYGALPNSTTKSSSHGIPVGDLDRIIDIEGFAYDPVNKVTIPIPDGGDLKISVTESNIVITTTTDYSAYTECFITLYYTKTLQ